VWQPSYRLPAHQNNIWLSYMILNVLSLKLVNGPAILNILVKAELWFACPPVHGAFLSIIKSFRATLLSLLIIALVPRVRGLLSGVVGGWGWLRAAIRRRWERTIESQWARTRLSYNSATCKRRIARAGTWLLASKSLHFLPQCRPDPWNCICKWKMNLAFYFERTSCNELTSGGSKS
jgi:hypothetical protein